MKETFDYSSYKISALVTAEYSTSFSTAARLLTPRVRKAIYGIYGFVRYADEIVDSFQNYAQEELLAEFEAE
jgi:phytoene/squalene synthetase